jgi:hypothetical protein
LPHKMRPLSVFCLFLSFFSALLGVLAAPKVTLTSNTILDSSGVYFVSYDGLVNVNSFQLSGVLTYGSYQYAGWYSSSRSAMLARRQLPSGAWSTLELPHKLVADDSHNVVTLGVSPQDGRIHVALDCHSTKLYYTVSEAGLATSGASWVASRFGGITNTLGGLDVGRWVKNLQSSQPIIDSNLFEQYCDLSSIRGHSRQPPPICLPIRRLW